MEKNTCSLHQTCHPVKSTRLRGDKSIINFLINQFKKTKFFQKWKITQY